VSKKKKRESCAATKMASASSGYVAVPRCPLTFNGANYADFAAQMRVHMHGLRLWGVLCGEVPYPSRPLTPVAPVLSFMH
jgi:hypothetical protein